MSEEERVNFTRLITQIIWEAKQGIENEEILMTKKIRSNVVVSAIEIKRLLYSLALSYPEKSAGEISNMLYSELRKLR